MHASGRGWFPGRSFAVAACCVRFGADPHFPRQPRFLPCLWVRFAPKVSALPNQSLQRTAGTVARFSGVPRAVAELGALGAFHPRTMKQLRALLLSLICAFVCAACGTMRTEYDLPASATAQQKQQAMRAVDAVAHRLGFIADTREIERARSEGSRCYRRCYRDSLSLYADITPRLTYVFLWRAGRTKTPDFLATEAAITAALHRISPDIVIVTGYVQNPMM